MNALFLEQFYQSFSLVFTVLDRVQFGCCEEFETDYSDIASR